MTTHDDEWVRVRDIVYRRCDVSRHVAEACADEVLSAGIHRLEQSLADALVDADAWRDRARRIHGLAEEARLFLWEDGEDAVSDALVAIAAARKVWEEAA